MTDSKTVVEDLAAWLTAIWDERERLAKEALSYEASDHDGPFLRHAVDYLGPELADHIAAHDPASVLARIAADRKILALHGMTRISWNKGCVDPTMHQREYCGICDHGRDDDSAYPSQSSYPCTTVRLLAEPHADKPGFRSEWLVERQGVEW